MAIPTNECGHDPALRLLDVLGRPYCRACRVENNRKRRELAYAALKLRAETNTHCLKGHPLSGDNLRISKGRKECRTCLRAWWRRSRLGGPPVGREVVERVLEALYHGKTINNIAGKRGIKYVGGRIIRSERLLRFCADQPKLGRRILDLAEQNKKAVMLQINSRRRLVAAQCLLKNNGKDGWEAIMAATIRLPDFLRSDVQAAMFLAMAEGKLRPSDAASRVREFVTQHNRMFTQYVPGTSNAGKMLSLDQPVYEDGMMTRADTVTRGLWEDS